MAVGCPCNRGCTLQINTRHTLVALGQLRSARSKVSANEQRPLIVPGELQKRNFNLSKALDFGEAAKRKMAITGKKEKGPGHHKGKMAKRERPLADSVRRLRT